jgi:hypothetical protein
MLVIIAMIVGVVGMIMTIGNLYFTSDSMGKMDKKIDSISSNVTAIKADTTPKPVSQGVIVAGGG